MDAADFAPPALGIAAGAGLEADGFTAAAFGKAGFGITAAALWSDG
jgi:hypothetical protein